MDIGGRNQAQPHRLRRHIRQRTVHREENRREKAGERQGFQKESGVTLLSLSHQKTATAVFSFAHGLRSCLLYSCDSVYLSYTSLCTHMTTVYTTLYSSGSRPSVSCGEIGGGRANIKAHSVRRPCLIPLMATILRCRKKTGAADPQARLRQGKSQSTSLTFKLKRKWKKTLRKFLLTHCLIW